MYVDHVFHSKWSYNSIYPQTFSLRSAGWCFMRGARTVYARAISDPASLNFDVIGSEQPVSNFGVIGPKSWAWCMGDTIETALHSPCSVRVPSRNP